MDQFEQKDREFMDRLKEKREKGVPPQILNGFSASVESKILEKTAPKEKKAWAPMLAPAFAVMVLASWLVLKNGPFQTPDPAPTMAMMLTGTADLFDEIRALEELGAWSEEDQEALQVSDLEVAPE